MGARSGKHLVSITQFLHDSRFDAKTVRMMSATFDRICAELDLKPQDPAAEVLAFKIIQLIEDGVGTPAALYLDDNSRLQSPGPGVAMQSGVNQNVHASFQIGR